MISNSSILLISPQAWGVNYVSKHHYASELAQRGNKIYFLNPPGEAFSIQEKKENLFVVNYKAKYKGVGKLPSFLASRLIAAQVKVLEKAVIDNFDVIWNFDSSRFFDLSKVTTAYKICHLVDMNENIHQAKLASTSDICFCTSEYIKKRLLEHNPNTHKINHGVSVYQHAEPCGLQITGTKPKVGYIGNLTISYIDWELGFHVIENHPEVDFHFVGAFKSSNLSKDDLSKDIVSRIKTYTNVFLHGNIAANQIPNFLKQMDANWCFYKMETQQDIEQMSNVHKMLEYLSSGKTVISSYVAEYQNSSLINMAQSKDQFLNIFTGCIQELKELNKEELQQQRIAFAEENTYPKQLDKIEKLING